MESVDPIGVGFQLLGALGGVLGFVALVVLHIRGIQAEDRKEAERYDRERES